MTECGRPVLVVAVTTAGARPKWLDVVGPGTQTKHLERPRVVELSERIEARPVEPAVTEERVRVAQERRRVTLAGGAFEFSKV